MTRGYDDPTIRIPFAVETLGLVADPTAALCGELLAQRAMARWRLPLAHLVVPRVRALVAAASAAIEPLEWIEVRLELHIRVLVLEVAFARATPAGLDLGTKAATAASTWHRDDRGRLCLRDEFPLHAPLRRKDSYGSGR